jgi:hypothetical protein
MSGPGAGRRPFSPVAVRPNRPREETHTPLMGRAPVCQAPQDFSTLSFGLPRDMIVTVREYLALRKRRSSIVTFSGFAAFVAGTIVGAPNRMFVAVGIVGFAVSFCSIGYSLILIRCPVCRRNLGQLLASVGGPFSVSPALRCCPFCTTELDSPMPAPGQPGQALPRAQGHAHGAAERSSQ